MNTYQITVLPYDRILNADEDENLLHILQQNSLAPEAPCAVSYTHLKYGSADTDQPAFLLQLTVKYHGSCGKR